jgi:peptidoglycan-associated lipoprotein
MSGHRWVVGILVVGLLLTGCAKRPAATGASAPPPAGGSTAAAEPAKPGTPAPAGTATSAPRPPASEFAENANLKDIHFDFDKSNIRPGDAKILDTSAGWLKSNPGQIILIEGHCDERGTDAYNLALGERRAKATQDYLVSQGIAARRMTTISYGESRPLCNQHTEECWARNRRAHFLSKPE